MFQVTELVQVLVVSLRLALWGNPTGNEMTSKTDINQISETGSETNDLDHRPTSRSADLEKILVSLGHAVTSSQHKNDESLKEIGARAEELGGRAADAKEMAPVDEADIFDSIEDQMADIAEKIKQSNPHPAPVASNGDQRDEAVLPVPDPAVESAMGSLLVDEISKGDDLPVTVNEPGGEAALWDQGAADELARLYSEIDTGIEGDDLADCEIEVVGRVGELQVSEGVAQSENQPLEASAERESGLSAAQEDSLDAEYLAVADAASQSTLPVDLMAGVEAGALVPSLDVAGDVADVQEVPVVPEVAEAEVDIAEIEVAEVTRVREAEETLEVPTVIEDVADVEEIVDVALANVAGGDVEHRFADIAERIEVMLSGSGGDVALKSIESRFDHLEEKLSAIIEYPENADAILALETQMMELKEQFHHVELQVSRLGSIESNVKQLLEDVKNSKGDFATALAGASIGGGVAQISQAGGDEREGRLAALQDVLEGYILERREIDQHGARAISSIQSGVDDIADYLVSQDPQLSAQEPEHLDDVSQLTGGPVENDVVGGGLAIKPHVEAENVEAENVADDMSGDIEIELPESVQDIADASGAHGASDHAASAHGAAQHAHAMEAMAQERAIEEKRLEDSHHVDSDENAALVAASAEAVVAPVTTASSQTQAGEAPQTDALNAMEIAEEDDAAETATPRQSEAMDPAPGVPEAYEAQRKQFIAEAKNASENARAVELEQATKGPEAVRAGNFLASARKAAIVAAARLEAERVADEAKQTKKKKKRSLFSFKLGKTSPALLLATTMLTATTAGFVYTQLDGQKFNNQIAFGAEALVPDVAKNYIPTLSRMDREASASSRQIQVTDNSIVHNASFNGGAGVSHGAKLVINDVPHVSSEDLGGVDVPVGIILDEPSLKPDLKQLAALKRNQALAKMSADITGEKPTVAITNIALKPEGLLVAPKLVRPQNNAPTLALPPASIGPFSLRIAAAKGDAGSQFDVATRFAQGHGIKRDFSEAVKWYGRAAAQGHAIAQYRLAALYEKGQGVSRDGSRAVIWYRRSAEKGNIKAMHNLAVLYTGRNKNRPDYATAAHWFKSAAERGLADSQFNLAILYANGLGVKRSKVEAYKWFSLAEARGDKEAGKRKVALKSAMSGSQIKAGEKIVSGWQGKPTVQAANIVHKAAALLKKKSVNVDQVRFRQIMQTQSMLGKLGYSVGSADGRMGPKTRDAIRNFQKRSGMKITGDVSVALIKRLSGLVG